MFKKVLYEAYVRIDFSHILSRTPESIARELEQRIKEFEEFLRDHRSQDIQSMEVVRVYKYRCSLCGWYHPSPPGPDDMCCQAAQAEYDMKQAGLIT